jgi:hypothetical protein
MTKKINWQTSSKQIEQEMKSKDGTWSISVQQRNDEPPVLFLSNHSLLLSPCAHGESYHECFEKFIQACDKYIERINQAKAEAQAQLTLELPVAPEGLLT